MKLTNSRHYDNIYLLKAREVMLIDIEKFNFIHFSGGEVHLNSDDFFKVLPKEKSIGNDVIWAPIHNSVDLMELLILTDAYKRFYEATPYVCIPYIPYARQDRVANDGEALSIKVFADIINAQNYPAVYVMDPHSEVCMALINRVKQVVKISDNYLSSFIPNYKECVALAPDAGAFKRLSKVIKEIPLIYATKQRDTKTGKLSNVELHVGNTDITGKKLLVIDDICDGGGTFLLLKSELVKNGINNDLDLYVSHGIFSKGTSILKDSFKTIYTTNSFYESIDSGIIVKDLKEYLWTIK